MITYEKMMASLALVDPTALRHASQLYLDGAICDENGGELAAFFAAAADFQDDVRNNIVETLSEAIENADNFLDCNLVVNAGGGGHLTAEARSSFLIIKGHMTNLATMQDTPDDVCEPANRALQAVCNLLNSESGGLADSNACSCSDNALYPDVKDGLEAALSLLGEPEPEATPDLV